MRRWWCGWTRWDRTTTARRHTTTSLCRSARVLKLRLATTMRLLGRHCRGWSWSLVDFRLGSKVGITHYCVHIPGSYYFVKLKPVHATVSRGINSTCIQIGTQYSVSNPNTSTRSIGILCQLRVCIYKCTITGPNSMRTHPLTSDEWHQGQTKLHVPKRNDWRQKKSLYQCTYIHVSTCTCTGRS